MRLIGKVWPWLVDGYPVTWCENDDDNDDNNNNNNNNNNNIPVTNDTNVVNHKLSYLTKHFC
jgi:hypothetical protein